jgi:hypothetical protein
LTSALKPYPLSFLSLSRHLLSPRCPATAATEEASYAEEVPEVVPTPVVVNLIHVDVAFEQRDDKHDWRDEALPETNAEASNRSLIVKRSLQLIRTRRTSCQEVQKQHNEN